MSYAAFVLDNNARRALLDRVPPKYPDVLAHHITEKFGIPKPSDPVRSRAVHATVIGHVDDGAGVQAVVVEVNGSSTRKDGSTYHITVSIDRSAGRKPVDSNRVIKEKGWTKVQPFTILAYYDILD